MIRKPKQMRKNKIHIAHIFPDKYKLISICNSFDIQWRIILQNCPFSVLMDYHTLWLKEKDVSHFLRSIGKINILPIEWIVEGIESSKLFPDGFSECPAPATYPKRICPINFAPRMHQKSSFPFPNSSSPQNHLRSLDASVHTTNRKHFFVFEMLNKWGNKIFF